MTETTMRMLSFEQDAACPKCGGHALDGPFYHDGRRRWFLHHFILLRRCLVRALDHFHYRCLTCGLWHARACRDIKERL